MQFILIKNSECRSSRDMGKSLPRGSVRPPSGFALVITLSLMVLMVLLAVSLLGLSSVAMRTSALGIAAAEARSNARMALMLAIGELQEQLGPDQRISARAEILDKQPDTAEIDDVTYPNYLGVWDSWDTWLIDQMDGLSIQDTYKRGRDPALFRRWLVSNPAADDFELTIGGDDPKDPVTLVGEGSSGSDTNHHVRVEKVAVMEGAAAGGKYGWWISDEAQKARIDLMPRDEADSPEMAATRASQTGRMGIEEMTNLGAFDTSEESLPKMVTIGQARISEPAAEDRFHDITAFSLGLLTDVRSGGFRSDINLAFESDVVPDEMDETKIFSGRSYDAPIRPMTGALAKITPQNPYVAPMSWRQLREYYRVYRELGRQSNLYPITWNGNSYQTQRFVMGKQSMQNKWDTAGYTRQPVMLRQTWIIATKTEINRLSPGGSDYFVLAIPVVSLWNPYNIALEVSAEEISYFGSMFYAAAMVQRTYRGSMALGERRFPDEDSWGGGRPNGDITANQLGYRMIVTGGKSGAIRFEPGEVRVFSTNDEILHGQKLIDSADAMNSRHFFATPGYRPVEDSGSGVLRGLKNRVNPGSGTGELTFALRLAVADRTIDPYWVGASRKSTIAFSFQEALAAERGAYYDNGSLIRKQEWHDVVRLQSFSIDWLTDRDVPAAWIVSDSSAGRARFPAAGSPPMPIGIFSVVAKTPQRLVFDGGSGGYANDFRNRGWLHAPVTGMGAFLMNPNDLNRADSAYQLHFKPVNGDQEVSQWLQADGENGYFGGAFTPLGGHTHVSALDLPVAPIVNLGSFAGVRMGPARSRIDQKSDSASSPRVDSSSLPGRGYHNLKHQAHNGGGFGVGIGNAYAHPMVEATGVYTRNDFGTDLGWDGENATKLAITDDYWDHLFLANEGLWDSWFCSGIAPVMESGTVKKNKEAVAKDFFSNDESHVSRKFEPYLRGKSADEVAELIGAKSGGNGENGWEKLASYMLNKGQFNTNSTSREAWKALLMSLSDRPLALNEPEAGITVLGPEEDEVTVTRHPLSNNRGEAKGPEDPAAWQGGVRRLTGDQIDKLADEIVRQVKLRGPFLNMAEFINRRLTAESTGVTGALQAAIDWDEFDNNYSGVGGSSGASINAAYKDADSMISSLPANYPNPQAAKGSLYAGIPGYVMQSDLLQGLGTSLTVRGDTFLIRTYGESLDPSGQVAARAWCEATVQRLPEYVDPEDAADKKFWDPEEVPGGELDLNRINRKFGRKFEIVAFRWLSEKEV